jgi:hypothetical protein
MMMMMIIITLFNYSTMIVSVDPGSRAVYGVSLILGISGWNPSEGMLNSCVIFSLYAVYFTDSMHCVLLINLIYVVSYVLQCTTCMVNNTYT